MKKIIALLLALSCVFALIACGGDSGSDKPCTVCADENADGKCDVCGKDVEKKEEDNLTDEQKKIIDFASRISASAPTFIKTLTYYNDGENGNTLVGKYETTVYGENFKMYYEHMKYALPEAGADPDGFMTPVPGTIYFKDGMYSLDNMQTWTTAAPDVSVLGAKFNITAESIGEDYEFTADGKTLTVLLPAEYVDDVFGIEVSAKDGYAVEVQIVTDGEYLRNVNISYETKNATVSIQTSYTYGPVESPFEEAPAPSQD